MSYVIACWQNGTPYALTANAKTNLFELIPLNSDVALNRIFSHPYRAGAQQILTWINDNDKGLACKELSIQDEARFRK
jgi:hypothetical protein